MKKLLEYLPSVLSTYTPVALVFVMGRDWLGLVMLIPCLVYTIKSSRDCQVYKDLSDDLTNENIKKMIETKSSPFRRSGVTCDRCSGIIESLNEPANVLTPHPNHENRYLSESDKDLLAELTWWEARGEDFQGQVLVTLVVLNRLAANNFPNTVKGVIYEPRQFTPTSQHNFGMNNYTQTQMDAVDFALQLHGNVNDYSLGATFFRSVNGVTGSWHERSLTPLFNHGGHAFFK